MEVRNIDDYYIEEASMSAAQFYKWNIIGVTTSQQKITKYRTAITKLTNGIITSLLTISVHKTIIKNVIPSTAIIYLKALYKYELTKLVFLTNIGNKTLTKTHYERVKETFDDTLQLQFELFGMATHKEWSAETTKGFDYAQTVYNTAIKLQSL